VLLVRELGMTLTPSWPTLAGGPRRCRVTLAADGQEAVEFYRRHHREVVAVLLGVQPAAGLAGPWTLLALKGIDPGVRCCFLSGDAGDHDTETLLSQGASCILHKPFRLGDLREALRHLLA
jgi:CheY-like chemotaxis protein